MKILRLMSLLAICLTGIGLEAKIVPLDMSQSLPAEINKYEFVIVKFSATWCGPCKALATTLHSLEKEFPNVTIIDVDVDKNPSVSKHIRSMPTMEFYVKGKKVNSIVGGQGASEIRSLIKNNFKTAPACSAPQKK